MGNTDKTLVKLTWNEIMQCLLLRCGLKPAEIQALAQVSRGYISDLMQGTDKGIPNQDTHNRLVKCLDPDEETRELLNEALYKKSISCAKDHWLRLKHRNAHHPEPGQSTGYQDTPSHEAEYEHHLTETATLQETQNGLPEEEANREETEEEESVAETNTDKLANLLHSLQPEYRDQFEQRFDPTRLKLMLEGRILPDPAETQSLEDMCSQDIEPGIVQELVDLAIQEQFHKFRRLLSQYRQDLDWSQSYLARKTNIGQSTISLLERDPVSRKQKIIKDAEKLAKGLNLDSEQKEEFISAAAYRFHQATTPKKEKNGTQDDASAGPTAQTPDPDPGRASPPCSHETREGGPEEGQIESFRTQPDRKTALDMAIGVYLQKARLARGIDHRALSRKTDLSEETIIQMENGKISDVRNIARFARGLELAYEEMLVLAHLVSLTDRRIQIEVKTDSPSPAWVFHFLHIS